MSTRSLIQHPPRRVFRDRREAGRALAELLTAYRGEEGVVVVDHVSSSAPFIRVRLFSSRTVTARPAHAGIFAPDGRAKSANWGRAGERRLDGTQA